MKVIGVLYTGDLGSEVARLLTEVGHSVITTVQGRSEKTKLLAEKAGIPTDYSLEDIAQTADIVISLVPPDKARDVAVRFAKACKGRSSLYVEANSVAPMTAKGIRDELRNAGIDMVDAAFFGSSQHLQSHGVLYISGGQCKALADIFQEIMSVRVLGSEVGQASSMKMLIGGLNKGLAALFIELACAAEKGDMLQDMISNYEVLYPGIMEVIRRIIPTYPSHAVRRVAELSELAETMSWLGSSSNVIEGARTTIELISSSDESLQNLEEMVVAWSALLRVRPSRREE